MEDSVDEVVSSVRVFIHAIRQEPGVAFLLGLLIGLFIREMIDIMDIVKIWIRNILIGQKRRRKSDD